MSPEQAGLEKAEVDAKSDIYSLGVLLYELLVGHHPFDVTEMTLDESAKTIREKIPELPSNRINTEADKTFFRIAKRRRIEPTHLKNALKGDLDQIVMKCLEKEPKNRYRSVEELAIDLEKHLAAQLSSGIDNPFKLNYSKWVAAIAGVFLLVGMYEWINYQSVNQVPVARKNATQPDYSTPDGLFREMTNAIDGKAADISELEKHETVTGKIVWGWLIEKQWLRNKGIPRVVARDIECDDNPNKHTLDLIYDSKDGTEHLRVDFFTEGGILKFHDIYLKKMKDDTFEMYLSDFIYNPHWAGIKFGLKNPGKVIGSVFGK